MRIAFETYDEDDTLEDEDLDDDDDSDVENISMDMLDSILQKWKEKDRQDAQSFHQREHKNEVLLNMKITHTAPIWG